MLNRPFPLSRVDAVNFDDRFDLHEIIGFLWRQWIFIGAVVALVLLVGGVYLLRITPLYTATVQVLLDPRQEKAGGTEAILSDVNLDIATIESQMAIIRSTVLLRRVASKERLHLDPEFGSVPAATGAQAVAAQREPDEAELAGTIARLQGAISVSKGRGYIIEIAVTSVDPQRAARIANGTADAFIVDKLDARFEAAKKASGWLSERLAELRKQVQASEQAVAQFRARHGLITGGANITLTQQQLADLNGRLVAAKAETAERKARFDLVFSGDDKGVNPQALPDLYNAPSVSVLRGQDAAASQREADLVSRYGDRHPEVVNIRAERRDIKRNIAAEVRKLSINVKNEFELAKAREESLERSLREVTGQQADLDTSAAITLRELERTAQVNKTLFEDFLRRAKITQEQSTFEAREARVITPARPPGAPSYPNGVRFMAVALMIGLMLGVGGAIAKEKLNVGFTTPQQVEEFLELPLLSSITQLEARDLTVSGQITPIPLYPAVKPLSRYSEAIRAIRSGVQMTDVDNPPKIIQLTSTAPSEGKTTIALSIATSAASSGQKVLVIDADLRHPSATNFFGCKKEQGLVDLLLGQANPQDVVRHLDDVKLWFLPAGSMTQNPPDLLGSDRMKTFIANFRQSFDLVVIDTPPVGPVIDPIVISQIVDKVVFVVRWAVTARELVKQSVQQIPGHKKVAGVIFNYVNDNEAQKYGRYAYSYFYGARYYKNYYKE